MPDTARPIKAIQVNIFFYLLQSLLCNTEYKFKEREKKKMTCFRLYIFNFFLEMIEMIPF